jgi:predicted phosphodiesterase
VLELFLCDTHIPHADPKAIETMLDFVAGKPVDKVVLGGDIVEFESVSSWPNDPNGTKLPEEIQAGREFLGLIKSVFPFADKVYIEGNHEERFRRYLWKKAPAISGIEGMDVEGLLNLKALGFTYINNKELIENGSAPYAVGKLYHFHGHELRSAWGVVNVARTAFLKAQDNIIVGHYHKSQEYIHRSVDGSIRGGWSVGSLSNLGPQFMPVNNFNHGFALIEHEDDGFFAVRNYKIIDGRVL